MLATGSSPGLLKEMCQFLIKVCQFISNGLLLWSQCVQVIP